MNQPLALQIPELALVVLIGQRFGNRVEFLPVGPVDAVVGAPTQMGVFMESSDAR